MDLALELGMPLAVIGRMPEREFARWARYASQKGLPMRRLEYYLAQIAQYIAITMGGSKATLLDLMIPTRAEEEDDSPPTAEDIAELRALIGFKPEGRPRRKKVDHG